MQQTPVVRDAVFQSKPVLNKERIGRGELLCGEVGHRAKEQIHRSENAARPPFSPAQWRLAKISEQPIRLEGCRNAEGVDHARELLRGETIEEEIRND